VGRTREADKFFVLGIILTVATRKVLQNGAAEPKPQLRILRSLPGYVHASQNRDSLRKRRVRAEHSAKHLAGAERRDDK
jgi:hypothetical protein